MKGNTLSDATSASLSPDNTTAVSEAGKAEQKPQQFVDDLHRLQYEALEKSILERNDLVGRANAANGDRVSLEEQIRNNSTDPQIASLREQISELIMELDAKVKPLVDEAINSASGDVNEIEEKIKATDKTLKAGLAYFKNVYGDDAAAYFTKQDRLKGTQLRSGSGGRRIRGYDLTVTVDGEDRTFENFSTAAKHIGVDTVELQRAFMDKAGTEKAEDFPDQVKFVVNFTEVDDDKNETEKSAMVEANKNEKAASKDEAADSTEEPEDDDVTSDDVDLENL